MTAKPDWIGVDWGTTHLRIWVVDAAGAILCHRTSDKGMGRLTAEEFEPVLVDLIGGVLPAAGALPVIVCGMAGSRQGWAEAAYRDTPCPPPVLQDARRVKTKDTRIDVHILPGIKQNAPPDVIRGEETQIAGFLADNPGFAGTLCLPGTHTKWARIRSGTIEWFRTFMTGEMFALLAAQSVLRHTVSADDIDGKAFRAAIEETAGHPEHLTAFLFGIRAAGLIADLSPGAARGRLSGLLIGAELAAMREHLGMGQVAVIGAGGVARAYVDALETLGVSAMLNDAEATTLKGLALARQHLSEPTQ
ncbi:MAG: 2-dehydro-3-deoxygalactonokinase [Roseibium sp.]|nr:2-dehydro-3-deoxygalactonokinase [Roseibium sp.]